MLQVFEFTTWSMGSGKKMAMKLVSLDSIVAHKAASAAHYFVCVKHPMYEGEDFEVRLME